jgi:hypothetical protein
MISNSSPPARSSCCGDAVCRTSGRASWSAPTAAPDLTSAPATRRRVSPLPSDPLAGVHPDHITVAEAVRRVAYMINVPHAFLDFYPTADETQSRWLQTPVILNAYDGYMAGANAGELAIDVEAAFDVIAEESWCHQCQINEWLPWVARHHMKPTADLAAWKASLRERFVRQARELGLPTDRAWEVFVPTAWGTVPTLEQLERDLPLGRLDPARRARLAERLAKWAH